MSYTKAPRWSKVPRSRVPAEIVPNGWKSSRELLVSCPRLGLKLPQLLGVDTALIGEDVVTVSVDDFVEIIDIANLADFTVNPTDYIVVRVGATVLGLTETLVVEATDTATLQINYSDELEDVVAAVESVLWASSDEEVATVDALGVVTAVSEGEVTISGIYKNVTGSFTLTVTPIV